jgi:hypothetical protein
LCCIAAEPLAGRLERGRSRHGTSSYSVRRIWPAGRASCAEGGHFVICVPLRVVLPLVAWKISVPTSGKPEVMPPYTSRSDRCPRRAPTRQR